MYLVSVAASDDARPGRDPAAPEGPRPHADVARPTFER